MSDMSCRQSATLNPHTMPKAGKNHWEKVGADMFENCYKKCQGMDGMGADFKKTSKCVS